jgi:hypothetical protein
MLHTSFGILASSKIAEEDIAIEEERSDDYPVSDSRM